MIKQLLKGFWFLVSIIPLSSLINVYHYRHLELKQVQMAASYRWLLYFIWMISGLFYYRKKDFFGFYYFCQNVKANFTNINFSYFSLGDFIRFPIQCLYLFVDHWFMIAQKQQHLVYSNSANFAVMLKAIVVGSSRALLVRSQQTLKGPFLKPLYINWLNIHWLRLTLSILMLIFAFIAIIVPFDDHAQLWFSVILWAVALWLRAIEGRVTTLVLMFLAIIAASRYIYWRSTNTLNWDDELGLVLGAVLLIAEIYTWLVLLFGFLQTAWPLKRQVTPLPKDPALWPSVDVYIPTYNEPVEVVKPTIIAALNMDWPQDKLNVYLLDDGQRESMAQLAKQVGCNYITRDNNNGAKAGNLNNAMTLTHGELITIFDCDHIPVRAFLQLMVGGFLKDNKLALVQSPHHFFSDDPVAKNLRSFGGAPAEGELFYGLIQDGNDLWNATFFCGSCAVLRRSMLEEIGGIATETVTEDAHTALKFHKLGYHSAYINVKLAAGLATESISAHVGQRIRWARGMAQIFRTDNPWFAKGLSFMQKVCYSSAMLHFFFGLPRLVFLLSPLAFLLLHTYIIYSPALTIFLYVLPSIFMSQIVIARHHGKYRNSFWGDMYETLFAWYTFRPTMVALFSPQHGSFNVTEKGGFIEKDYLDWLTSRPVFILIILNLIGFSFGIWRLMTDINSEHWAIFLNMLWTFYNLLLLGGVLAVATELKQIRKAHRIKTDYQIQIKLVSGHVYPAKLADFSESGMGIQLQQDLTLDCSQQIKVIIDREDIVRVFDARIMHQKGRALGLKLVNMTLAKDKELIEVTFSRADSWQSTMLDNRPDEKLGKRFWQLLNIGTTGYRNLWRYSLSWLQQHQPSLYWVYQFIKSFLPKRPKHG
ncbi:UDP-forming cellulose synthase catalytic subunit [Paraferrimonas sp. SM1919]|uniref:UDP-forming cellulose synthase catalytic subunit n=1 Tax=Paraferrimonas sp. SM1919 TaxID=2662263 RepID=UPI0013D615F0|nr:UDP-forming cellulose synthase catalytic subunit [Paraferrimonas sp. SM1919]